MQMVDGSTVSVDNIDVVGQDSGKYFPENGKWYSPGQWCQQVILSREEVL